VFEGRYRHAWMQGRVRRPLAVGVPVVTFLVLTSLVVFAARAAGDSSGPPPGYAAVVRGLPGASGFLSMALFDQRKSQVRAERRLVEGLGGTSVSDEALRQLLEEPEVEAEARRMGIRVGARKVTRLLRRTKRQDFPSIGSYRRYLKKARLTEGEARRRIRGQILFKRIEEHVTAGAPPERRSTRLRRYAVVYLRRWRSKTTCVAALATERCSNGAPLSDDGGEVVRVGPSPP
jgi:hypothetical protein